jgi:hypothetical protein
MSQSSVDQVYSSHGAASDPPEAALDQIRLALRGLRFGSVNVIVQDGIVIQIDRTEKKRLREGRPGPQDEVRGKACWTCSSGAP